MSVAKLAGLGQPYFRGKFTRLNVDIQANRNIADSFTRTTRLLATPRFGQEENEILPPGTLQPLLRLLFGKKKPQPLVVVDPFAEWGARAVEAAQSGCTYLGATDNPYLVDAYQALMMAHPQVTLHVTEQPSEWPPCDLVWSAPPPLGQAIRYPGEAIKAPRQWYTEFLWGRLATTIPALRSGGYLTFSLAPLYPSQAYPYDLILDLIRMGGLQYLGVIHVGRQGVFVFQKN